MTKTEIETAIENYRGKWVRKSRYTLFDTMNGKMPVFFVKHPFKSGNTLSIGHGMRYNNVSELPVIITEDEARSLREEFEKLSLSEPIDQDVEKTCYTYYTGEKTEKRKIEDLERGFAVLFQQRMLHRDKDFQLYLCPNCKTYHIGKPADSVVNQFSIY